MGRAALAWAVSKTALPTENQGQLSFAYAVLALTKYPNECVQAETKRLAFQDPSLSYRAESAASHRCMLSRDDYGWAKPQLLAIIAYISSIPPVLTSYCC